MTDTKKKKKPANVRNVIYEPTGPALEYAPLAANLYRGCEHGCGYCYAPAALRVSRSDFCKHPEPRTGVLEALAKDAEKFEGTPKHVLLSFTSDPYQPIEFKCEITRQAIKILADKMIPIRTLTKRPMQAMTRDRILLQNSGVEFGVSLCFTNDIDRVRWEPRAENVADRAGALEWASASGLVTWVSIEPVIDPAQAIGVIQWVHEHVDAFKIGKLNHDADREAKIDWREFLFQTLRTLNDLGSSYYIKDDLWRWADREIRETWEKAKD